ncbi:MAG: sulfotransferase [Anaerolineae bacterium]|nr:sulfotransferase [Anaerolineae bacterium]
MSLLQKLFGKKRKEVIVVSGLPRSGTSMMMKMLEAGGMAPLTDHIRVANDDNPQGYYEFERVKKLPEGDTAWLEDAARGKVVKIISALLIQLPDTYDYKVLFMRRHLDEILASQKQMLIRREEDPDKVNDAEMSALFEKHLAQVYAWMDGHSNVTYLDVDYNQMLADPGAQVPKINAFLGHTLDEHKMLEVVEPALYRQRAQG